MSNFQEDLKKWREYEEKVKKKLVKEFWVIFDSNPDCKGVDLINELLSVEVKYDTRVGKDSKNVFLEISCSWEESGIFAYDSDYFIIGWDESFIIIKLQKLQELVMDWIIKGKYDIKKAWDWYRVRWLAVDYLELSKEGKLIQL